MGKKPDEDLRKEVELTEHQDSIQKVCAQYETSPDRGLTDSAAADVSKRIFTFKAKPNYLINYLSYYNLWFCD